MSRYTPIAVDQITPGMRVRATITEDGVTTIREGIVDHVTAAGLIRAAGGRRTLAPATWALAAPEPSAQ